MSRICYVWKYLFPRPSCDFISIGDMNHRYTVSIHPVQYCCLRIKLVSTSICFPSVSDLFFSYRISVIDECNASKLGGNQRSIFP